VNYIFKNKSSTFYIETRCKKQRNSVMHQLCVVTNRVAAGRLCETVSFGLFLSVPSSLV